MTYYQVCSYCRYKIYDFLTCLVEVKLLVVKRFKYYITNQLCQFNIIIVFYFRRNFY